LTFERTFASLVEHPFGTARSDDGGDVPDPDPDPDPMHAPRDLEALP
jgi:hypothetical protein